MELKFIKKGKDQFEKELNEKYKGKKCLLPYTRPRGTHSLKIASIENIHVYDDRIEISIQIPEIDIDTRNIEYIYQTYVFKDENVREASKWIIVLNDSISIADMGINDGIFEFLKQNKD